jgi:integrase/recombinase XerD
MFDTLFTRPRVLERHKAGPAAEERGRYLVHRASEGLARGTLLRIAAELLVVARWIDFESGKLVTLQDIDGAARRWADHQQRRCRANSERWSRQLFSGVATAWLRFLGQLADLPNEEPDAFAHYIEDFAAYLLNERGLSFTTVHNRRWHISHFLQTVRRSCGSIAQIAIGDIDAFLSLKGKEGWCRVSIATSAKAIRSFFRHAEMRGWCRLGIAAAIDAPRLFKHEGLPSGPSWKDVQRLIAGAGGSDPHDVRDRAILMLLAVYGLRSGEVRTLRIDDLDWTNEVITIKRPKQRRIQHYPLVTSVGDVVLQYLQHGRPHCARRELFVTVRTPVRPLSAGAMYHVVSSRLEPLGLQVPHHGPHCLRHACASHLVSAGLSLKEVGDHLGHCSVYATRVYAKVDLAGLREVADFDLRGLT